MKKTKLSKLYYIQASLDGGPWYNAQNKGFKSPKRAEKEFDRIIRDCYPTWRGLPILWRIVRTTVIETIETEIFVFCTPSKGTKRPLLAELFIPSWLPKKKKEELKMRRIPDAEERWQPTSQLPSFLQNDESQG